MEEQLAEIYRRFAPLIYRRCLIILTNPEDARDTTQDIFLLLQRKLKSFRGESHILTWIYRVTTNRCLNRLRSQKVHQRVLAAIKTISNNHRAQPSFSLERRQVIEQLLSRFDQRKVQIIFYRFYDDMSQAEIAKVMGMSERGVRKSLKTIMERVEQPLAELMASWRDEI